MKQLVMPNTAVTGEAGMCLEFQENVWGADHWYPNAISSWEANPGLNHPDQLPPDACVVVYWTYFDTSLNAQEGHIATWIPGKGVFTSPFNKQFGSEWYPDIQGMTNRINQIPGANSRYLGWSEQLANLRIVEGTVMPSEQDVNDYVKAYTGIPPTAKQISDYTHEGWRILTDDILTFVINQKNAQIADLQKQGNDLSAKVDNLTAVNLKLADQITALKANPVVAPNPDATKWETLKALLKELIS